MFPPKYSQPFSGLSPLILAALASLAAAVTAPAALYTFEGLSAGSLAGQDNWSAIGGSALIANGAGFDTSLVIKNPNSGGAHFNIRPNDGLFSFGSFTGTETNAILQFDVRVNSTPLVNENMAFYVADAAGAVSSSPQIQYGNTATGVNPIFAVVKANGAGAFSASLPGSVNFGDWVSVRLTMDFTANAGDGFGSVTMANLTQSTGYSAVTGLQNLALGMLNGAVNESAWNSMWTRTDLASGLTGDNLLVAPVPEPAAASIGLGLFAVYLGCRRRYRQPAI